MPRGSPRVVFLSHIVMVTVWSGLKGKAYMAPGFGAVAWSKERSQSEQGVRWGNSSQINGWVKRLPGMSMLLTSARNQVGDEPSLALFVAPGVLPQH